MRVEILSVGDELLTGSIVDTNSAYIAEHCEMFGLQVIRHSCVGDDLEQLSSTLQEITQRADIAIVTGGLGPTLDDLTREAAAKAAGLELLLNSAALTELETFFAKRSLTMPESNRRQAFFPKNALLLPNPYGTAPGFSLKIGSTQFFFTPGVPSEMKKMLHEQVMPRIDKNYSKLTIKSLKTFGMAEALLGQHLEVVAKQFPQLKLGTRAHFGETEIKLYARGKNEAEITPLLAQAEQMISDHIGNWIISTNGESIAETVGRLLQQQKATLALMEVATGGVMTNWLTDISKSTSFFAYAGLIAPSKVSLLLKDETPLSPSQMLAQLVRKTRQFSGSTYALALHLIATEEEAHLSKQKLGTAYIAFADAEGAACWSYEMSIANQEFKKHFAALFALDLLRRKLLDLPLLPSLFEKPLIRH